MLKSIFGSKGAFKSLTFWGVVSALGGTLVNAFDPAVLREAAPQADAILQTVGAVVTVLGLRKANVKAVAEVAKIVEGIAAKK